MGLTLIAAVLGGLDAPAWAWILVGVLALLSFARAYTLHVRENTGPASAPPQPARPADRELRSMRMIREMFERAERRKRDLVETEFVVVIEEGGNLEGNAFSGDPQWGDFTAWRDPIAEFVGATLGATEKQRLLEAGAGQPEVRNQIQEVMNWLRERRDHPDAWEAHLAGIDGPEIEAAIRARRDGLPLATVIDSMIREGRELVTELSTPVQFKREKGVLRIDGGEPSTGQQERADAFRQRAVDLLVAQSSALLVDYRDGCNDYIRRSHRGGEKAETLADRNSDAEKMLSFANAERRTAAWEVEVCLEGLARVRKGQLAADPCGAAA